MWVCLLGFMRDLYSYFISCKNCLLHAYVHRKALYRLCSSSIYVDMCNILLSFHFVIFDSKHALGMSWQCIFGPIGNSWRRCQLTVWIACSALRYSPDRLDCVSQFSDSGKFFGPSPRKLRLTVYRGLQVAPLFGPLSRSFSRSLYHIFMSAWGLVDTYGSKILLQRATLYRHKMI